MRHRILAALFPALLLSVALPACADEWSKKFTVTGKPEIRVETNDGNVRVDAVEANEIEARVETVGWRIADNEVRVSATQTGNRIELIARVLRRWNWSIGGQRHSLRIELKIPREATLSIQTSDGNITLNGVRGEMRLSTGDGNIDASGLDGRFQASTGDGHIKIDGRFDLLDLRTGDGSIRLERL